MATVDYARKFAEQASSVQQVLRQRGVAGDAGRVVMVLVLASKDGGVSQSEVVRTLKLPKDVVSKLVRSLRKAELLTQHRYSTNSRYKQLSLGAAGSSLLSEVRSILQPPQPAKKQARPTHKRTSASWRADPRQLAITANPQ